MKKFAACMLVLLLLCTPVTAGAEASDWDLSAPTEVTEEVRAIFDKATEGLLGVSYVPVCVLGVQGDTYCNDETVNEDGIQNIYELWIDKHDKKEEVRDDGEQDSAASETNADIQYVMYLGTNDKDTNKPVFTEAEAQEQVKDILIRHFGGYTIQEASGGWIDEGTVYQEYTLVIYLSDTTEEAVHAAADEMIETFRQSSVLIQTNPTRTEFYSGS